jgi:hypothetical protein
MKPTHRTLLAVALFLPLAALLLATFACLPAPVGDPDKSQVDASLSGIYKGMPTDPADKSTELAILKPWDAKTYLLEYMTVDSQDNKETRQIQHYKAWLTTLSEKTFLTAQPMDDMSTLLGAESSDKPFWLVLRVDKVPAGLELRMVNPDSEFLKNVTKQEEFEAAIKAHVSDNALYGDTITFKKLGKDVQAQIEEVLAKFNTK